MPAVGRAQSASAALDTPAREDLWRAYELAQRHYEADLQLFTTRMNLFLLIQSALVAVVTSATGNGKTGLLLNRSALASFGLALAIAWLAAAVSSYVWIKTWRAHMLALSGSLKEHAAVSTSPDQFRRKDRQEIHRQFYSGQILWKQLERVTWFIRPTFVICCLPLLFIGGWVYLGWYA
jgi:hypothetical protein